MKRLNFTFLLILFVGFFLTCARREEKTFTIAVILPNPAYHRILDGLKSEIEKSSLKDRIKLVVVDFPKTPEETDAACEIVQRLNPDLVYTVTTPVTLAAKKRIKNIPILFNAVGDPIGAGIVKDLRRRDEKITGITNFSRELTGKRLEIFKESCPNLKTVLTFYNPDNKFSQLAIKDLYEAARLLRLRIVEITGKNTDEIRSKMKKVNFKDLNGIYLMPDAVALSMFEEIIGISKQYKLPIMAHESGLVEKGATFSYGADFFELGQISYIYVSSILKGDKPEEMPLFFPDRFVFTVNKKSAEELGINIPNEVLFFADRIIYD